MIDSINGLKQSEVEKLRTQYGFNELPIKDKKNLARTLFRILSEPMFALLLATAFIYLLIGSLEDTLLLSGFIALSITITVYQENKSEKAIAALKDLSSPRTLVIRDGQSFRIPSRELLVGDLIILEEGDRIAADAKLIQSNDLLLDESLLTGESEPIGKNVDQYIYSGTMVVRGGGIARINAIGLQTEIGKIGKSLDQIDNSESPLQKDVRILIKRFAFFGIILSLIVCLSYGIFYQQWLTGALTGITLTMALLPEEFTVILTVFMALGVWRISRQHVLTRRASVIETLGSINTLCVDKTGTLTINKMSLQALVTMNQTTDSPLLPTQLSQTQTELLSYTVLASEIDPFDPMEKAFLESNSKLNPDYRELYANLKLVHEYGLTPELPAMTHLWEPTSKPNEIVIAIKGSPEAVMQLCKLSSQEQSRIEEQINTMASNGLRLLGVGKAKYTKSGNEWPNSVSSFEFEWLGLVGLKDPLRPEVPQSVKQCHDAGIRVIMITGDHAITAKAIATQAGINATQTLSGRDIDQLGEAELQSAVKEVNVFVRIKPDQKLRLVKALQATNEIVAMTGDGINDAPALKAAHVGISMGQRGTDVAREASSLVLLNDDFSSIVNTIRQGRQIFDNLQKAIIYVVAVHIPIAGAVFIPLLFNAPPLLGPIHILFLEMIIDPSCAIVFEAEAPESNVMKRPPRSLDHKIFSLSNLSVAISQGVGLLLIVLGLYLGLIWHDQSIAFATTIAFGTLVLGNLSLVIVSRSLKDHFFNILKKPNLPQYWIIGSASTIFVLFTLIPFFRDRFHFTNLTIDSIFMITIATVIGIFWHEIIKASYRRIKNPQFI